MTDLTITNPDGSVTVTLAYPILIEGESRAQLTLARVKGRQFRKLNLAALSGDGDQLLNLVGQLAAIPPSSLDQLDGADIMVLGEVVMGFLARGPLIGAASSPNAPTS